MSSGRPAVYRGLCRFNAAADRVLEALTGALLTGIVAINGAEIATRALAGTSLTWVYETNLLLANWLYFLGICLVYRRGQDITVDFLFERLPARARRPAVVAIHLVTIAVLAVLVWQGWLLMGLQSRSSSMGLGIPNHLFSMPVPLGAAVMASIVAEQLWALVRGEPAAPAPPGGTA